MSDDVSRTFHDHVRAEEGHGHEHSHSHSGQHPHEHGRHHHEQNTDNAPAKHTVAHIGGLSIKTLESAFNSTGLLENVVAMRAFSAKRREITDRPKMEDTEFQFIIGSGRRK